jgi:excisionase family DNA binding protein
MNLSPTSSHSAIIDLGPLAERVSATPRQTCTALSIGVTKLYELLGNGELASYREGKARRILVSSIRDYVARRLEASRPAA